ncbi:hypothetical protein QF014_000874 [Pantoea agglomerans]|nr:hypothetical protein [Pantoea agglomerans]
MPVAKHHGPPTKTPGAFLNDAKRWHGYERTSGMRCVLKTPGAFLNNATRWPGYGRTSGMRCVIDHAEPSQQMRRDRAGLRPGYRRSPYLKRREPVPAPQRKPTPPKTTEPPQGRLCIYLSGVRVTRFWPIYHSTLVPLPARISDDLPDHRAHLPHNTQSSKRSYQPISSLHEHAVSVRRGLLF